VFEFDDVDHDHDHDIDGQEAVHEAVQDISGYIHQYLLDHPDACDICVAECMLTVMAGSIAAVTDAPHTVRLLRNSALLVRGMVPPGQEPGQVPFPTSTLYH
jgi:hypothetical protein